MKDRFGKRFRLLLEKRMEHLHTFTSETDRFAAEYRRRKFEEAVYGCRDARSGIGMGIGTESELLIFVECKSPS